MFSFVIDICLVLDKKPFLCGRTKTSNNNIVRKTPVDNNSAAVRQTVYIHDVKLSFPSLSHVHTPILNTRIVRIREKAYGSW